MLCLGKLREFTGEEGHGESWQAWSFIAWSYLVAISPRFRDVLYSAAEAAYLNDPIDNADLPDWPSCAVEGARHRSSLPGRA